VKEDEKNMVPALIMEKTYSRILKKIEDVDYDVFSKPVRISGINKLLIAISVLLKYKIFG
jgi:phytoene/squalene synthetase